MTVEELVEALGWEQEFTASSDLEVVLEVTDENGDCLQALLSEIKVVQGWQGIRRLRLS